MNPDRLRPECTLVHPTAFVASGAVVAGEVRLGPQSSVWFHAVVRGDTERIDVGARCNVQDGAVLHADPGFPCVLFEEVTVGHRAIVHGAEVGPGAMIGMGAILLNGARVGAGSLVGAGALLPGGRDYPPGHLILGSPATPVRRLTEDEIEGLKRSAAHYVEAARHWRDAGFGDKV